MQVGGLGPRVAAEEPHLAGVLADQPEQDPQGGGLPGAVGPEEAVHLPRDHRQVEAVERAGAPERLDQTAYVDDRVGAAHARHSTLLSIFPESS